MKTKHLFFVAVLVVFCCLFATSALAAEPSTSDSFGEVTLITDNDAINQKSDYGYSEGDAARIVLQIPGTSTYMTYPMYYCFGVRNDGRYGVQPTPDYSALNGATGYNFDNTCVIRLEIPEYFTAISTNYTKSNEMTSLKYIHLNKKFIYIHSKALAYNTALETVIFEDNSSTEVSLEIGSNAFENDTALTQIRLPSHLTSIGERSFAGCTALTEISIPARLGAIGTASFLDCKTLATVTVPENNSITEIKHRAFDGCSALTGTFNFNQVKVIGTLAFRNCATNEGCYIVLNFPELTTMGTANQDANIFQNSIGIKEIYIGDKLSVLGINTFSNATGLWRCEIKGFAEGFTRIPPYTFDNCTSLKAFSIPEGITELPNRVFRNCISLQAVYLPSTLEKISSGSNDHATFKSCSSLYFVAEPFTYKTLEDIPSEPTVYYFPKNIILMSDEAFDNARLNDIVIIPEGVTSLTQGYTFEGCVSASGNPTVVFMGDMQGVSAKAWGVNAIYFCHPNDTDAASAGYSGSITAHYCFADGNTSHLKEKTLATDATCELPKMVADYCFCGQFIPGTEIPDGNALGHNYTGAVSYAFTTVTAKGEKCTVCVNNCGIDLIEALEPVYTELGFSANTTDFAITNGYKVNKESLALYEKEKGITVKLGFAFNSAADFTDGEVSVDSFMLKAEVNNQLNGVAYDFLGVNLFFTNDKHINDNIIVGVYVVERSPEGDNVSFINRTYEDGVNGFEAVSYNSLLNK